MANANHCETSDRRHPMKQSSGTGTSCHGAEPPELPPRDEPPGSLRCPGSCTPANPVLTLQEIGCSQIPKPKVFPCAPHAHTTMSHYRRLVRASGGEPRGAAAAAQREIAASKALNSIITAATQNLGIAAGRGPCWW